MIQGENKNEAAYSVVRYLNRLGFVVVEINSRFYVVTQFEEASPNSWKHSLDGKDISTLITAFVHINELDDSQKPNVLSKLETCTQVKKYFHKDYKFILHLQ